MITLFIVLASEGIILYYIRCACTSVSQLCIIINIKLRLFVSSQAPAKEMETHSFQGKHTERTAIYGM